MLNETNKTNESNETLYENNILLEDEYSIFNIINLLRVVFYTPLLFFGSVIVSVTYDYITFKEDKEEDKLSNLDKLD